MATIPEKNIEAVPLTILTGFLGAGKTTLLNHILNGKHGLKVGVLVNDFGSINIDAELVVDVEDDMISLANGCVCCQIRDDLVQSVKDLIERDEPVEYIILEASGVADPSSIYMTFVDAGYRDVLRLDSVTCVVDADQVFTYDDLNLAKLKLQQIGYSDLVILNKVDLAGAEQSEKVKLWIDHHFSRVRIIPAINCEVPLDVLLSVGRFDPAKQIPTIYEHDHHVHENNHNHHTHNHTDHGTMFDTWSFESDRPFARKALEEMIKRRLPSDVYRCKGIIYCAEHPDKRLVLQVVGRRSDIKVENSWGEKIPQTRVVAIARKSGLNAVELNKLFEDCLMRENAAVSA